MRVDREFCRRKEGQGAGMEQAGIICLGGAVEIHKTVYTRGISTDTHV